MKNKIIYDSWCEQLLIVAGILAFMFAGTAYAFQFSKGNNWDFQLNNTFQYNLGLRVTPINSKIGNNPNFDEADHKFASAGDIVTNRVSDLLSFEGVYQHHMGFHVSGSGWKDFAYNNEDKSAPGNYAPGIPYSSIKSYKNGKYSEYTSHYIQAGGELLDAYLFYNTTIDNTPIQLKVGRFTQQWGNAFFYGFQSISYSQSPTDFIKAFASPGSEIQELILPRTQVNIAANLTSTLSVNAQYFLRFEGNRFPEGGTFLNPTDFAYSGPDQAFLGAVPTGSGYVPFMLNAGPPNRPAGAHGNYGVRAMWSPLWAQGTIGFYYRHFDEVQPWSLIDFPTAKSSGNYHLAYNRNVRLYGMSYEHTFGNISSGFEVSYKQHTGLASSPSPSVPNEPQGATGSVLNVIANALVQLGTTPLYDTGTIVAEAAYTNVISVDHNDYRSLYNGVGYSGCPSGNNKWEGCATKNALDVAFVFDPQWLQVFPNVNLDMPISDNIGVYGNPGFSAGGFYQQANQIYSVGIRASNSAGNMSALLQYNGILGRPHGTTTTPSGAKIYAGGNGLYQYNDRNWVSLTLKYSY